MQLLRSIILLFCSSLLASTVGDVLDDEGVTEAPISYRTGKLNQFKGFVTPRPIPSNAQFMYASVWASWSAWSFCVNNQQVRVRACNTVRGFSCLGTNQEHKACDHPQPSQSPRRNLQSLENGDYDAVDPYEDDRKEAIRQLYSDYVPDVPQRPLKRTKPRQPVNFAAARGPGRPVNGPLAPPPMPYGGRGPQGPPTASKQHGLPQNHQGPPRAPSMTPELLFGSKLEPSSNSGNPPPPPPAGLTSFTENQARKSQEEVKPAKTLVEVETHPTASKTEAAASKHEQITTFAVTTGQEPSKIQESESHVTEAPSTLPPHSSTASPAPTTEVVKREGHPVMSKILNEDEVLISVPATTTKAPEQTAAAVIKKVIKTTSPKVPEPHPSAESLEVSSEPVKHLHSGEVRQDEEKKLLTSDTARALSWMLANMTKTAEDYEYDDDEDKEGSTTKNSQNSVHDLEEQLHSGEVVFPVLKPDRNDKFKIQKPDLELKRRVFAQRIHEAFGEMSSAPRTTESVPIWPESDETSAQRVDPVRVGLKASFPISQENNIRRAPPPSTPVKRVSVTPPSQARQFLHQSPVERIERPQKVELVQAVEGFKQEDAEKEQDALKQEIDKLRALMHDMESQIEKIKKEEAPMEKTKPEKPIESKVSVVQVDQKSHVTEDAREKAINLNLVPSGPRTKSEPLPLVISKSEADGFFVRASQQTKAEAEWSDWNSWNECFCNKQVRTRVCHYDDAFHSKGCEGKSYESRACVATRPCPALQVKKITRAQENQDTTPEYYTLAPPPRRRTGYAFRPNPLSLAVNRLGNS
ncbi:hypothetical protein L596_028415 [Steinernema carpocapsae]|uniref:ShKT domain-containing protein n=1 Tax=Steinernema carpocapsae TaxID=34508 RepID=A0A4U5LYG0_STECR|nr:hypothetical protein L596_028415 [Steinernema carpocapsae]